jgi:hypothetical protein
MQCWRVRPRSQNRPAHNRLNISQTGYDSGHRMPDYRERKRQRTRAGQRELFRRGLAMGEKRAQAGKPTNVATVSTSEPIQRERIVSFMTSSAMTLRRVARRAGEPRVATTKQNNPIISPALGDSITSSTWIRFSAHTPFRFNTPNTKLDESFQNRFTCCPIPQRHHGCHAHLRKESSLLPNTDPIDIDGPSARST